LREDLGTSSGDQYLDVSKSGIFRAIGSLYGNKQKSTTNVDTFEGSTVTTAEKHPRVFRTAPFGSELNPVQAVNYTGPRNDDEPA
jgi:hypothetical protein